jgi:hypothetical protein
MANSNPIVSTQQLAQVARLLKGVSPKDPLLQTKFNNAFQNVLGGAATQRADQINIDLPDLDDNVQADMVKENITALSALYFAAQLEELKFFAVADKVADQFMTGVIPLKRSTAGGSIYQYIRDAPKRFTEVERRSIYARAFGFAQGSVDEPMPNRAFSDLWIRFLSSVSSLNRETNAFVRQTTTQQTVFKNGRDLAVNLSLHGYGVAHFAAVELQGLIKSLIDMLNDDDVLQAYGVLDVWQLVEIVSGRSLGGSVNSVRQRTLAKSGAKIIQWLSDHQQQLLEPATAILNVDYERGKDGLITHVEAVLAVTGTDDSSVEKYDQPISIATQPTIPDMTAKPADMLSSLSGMMGGSNGVNAALQSAQGALSQAKLS